MFARIGRLLRGFLGLFISGIEEANPEALMEAARQEFRDQDDAVQPGARQDGRRRRAAQEPGQRQGRRARRSSSAGSWPTTAPATWSSPARSRASCRSSRRDLDRRHRSELKETEEAYQANLRQAKLAQQEFEDKVRTLEKQLSQVKIKEAQAEAATALSSVAFKVGDLGDTMKTVEEVLAEALRGVGRQGARRQGHGRHRSRDRRRRTSARRSSRTRSPSSSRARASRRRRPPNSTPAAAKEIGPER